MIDVQHREHTGRAIAAITAIEVTVLTVRLRVVSAGSGRPLAGRPVRLWECGRTAVEVRISDGAGWAWFDGRLPPAGPGGWPHLHFEIEHREARLALPGDAYAAGAVGPAGLAAAFGAGAPPMIASVTGDARRGLVATRILAIGGDLPPDGGSVRCPGQHTLSGKPCQGGGS